MTNDEMAYENYEFDMNVGLSWLEQFLESQNETIGDVEDNTFRAMSLAEHNTAFTVPVYGYITPALCLVVLLTNILFLGVFAVRKMNSPTHIVLKGIAISDTLTILLPTPLFMHMYTMENYKEYVPYEICLIWDSFVTFLPTITHTASVWLTCLLAVQRYICVSFPLTVRLWCGIKKTYIFVIIICFLSTALNICRFFETGKVEITVYSRRAPSTKMQSCKLTVNRDFVSLEYQIIYYWVRAVLVNIIPCVVMVVFSGIMLCKIRKAERRRRAFLRRRSTLGSGQNEPRESQLTTWLVVVIVNSVIIVEMPVAIYFVLYATTLTTGQKIIPDDLVQPLEIILNLVVRASYPLLFVLYCCMSDTFRKTLRNMFCIPCAWCRNSKTCCRRDDADDSSHGTASNSRRSTGVSTVNEGGTINLFSTV